MSSSATSLVLIIVSQLTFILLVSTVFLFLFNRKLKTRGKTLTDRLETLEMEHAAQIKKLKTKSTDPGKEAPAETAREAKPMADSFKANALPSGSGASLDQCIDQTEARLNDLGVEPTTQFETQDSAEIMAARMRIAFLEAEKQIQPLANDPKMLWETLQPNIDKIVMNVRRHAAALSGKTQLLPTPDDSETTKSLQRLRNAIDESMAQLDDRHQQLISLLKANAAPDSAYQLADELTNKTITIANVLSEKSISLKNSLTDTDPHELDDDLSLLGDMELEPEQVEPTDDLESLLEEIDDIDEQSGQDSEEMEMEIEDLNATVSKIMAMTDDIDESDDEEDKIYVPPPKEPSVIPTLIDEMDEDDLINEAIAEIEQLSDDTTDEPNDMDIEALSDLGSPSTTSTPTKQSLDQNANTAQSDDPLDSMTFEDLLDGSGVDLYTDLDNEGNPPNKQTGT